MLISKEFLNRAPIRLLVWGVLAALAVLAFNGAMVRQEQRARERSLLFLAASPEQGRLVFREKGCVRCHSVNGRGGNVGPELAGINKRGSNVSALITAMWDHAPRMFERMHADGVSYPSLNYDEVAQLLTYLYMSGHVDKTGDAEHGRAVFTAKGCERCHSNTGNVAGNTAKLAGVNGIMDWSAAYWTHAPEMGRAAEESKIAWPQLENSELRDLYAFLHPTSSDVLLGDPERGWRAFQQKGCAGCHSIRAAYQLAGPNFGPEHQLPESFSEMTELMLSRSPQMQKSMARQGSQYPTLSAQEMSDIFAFLYSLRYVEPTGSPQVGASVFGWRGCSRCHGENAEGTSRAPSLHGRSYNSVALAAALWRHGQQMYAETRRRGLGWPTLTNEDVGDLLAFVNTPVPR